MASVPTADVARFGVGLRAGDRHYRAYVGPPERYDLIAAMQFNLLTGHGLRETHNLLDIGCGSLRLGRLAIPYLRPGNYYGIEPNIWLVEEGIEKECGRDLIRLKQASFSDRDDFGLTCFGTQFDYLVAQSIFSHAAARQIEACLEEACRCMHAHSQFFATFMAGETDYDGDQWLYPDCCRYRPEKMRAMASAHGLALTPVDMPHPHGQTWVMFRRVA